MARFIKLDDDNFTFNLFDSSVLLTRENDTWWITGPDLPSPIALDKPEANAAVLIGQKPSSSAPELLNIGLDPRNDELAPEWSF